MKALAILAKVLEQMSGRLLIFGSLKREDAERQGLARKSVELRGLLPSRELIKQFRREVDALFVPMSLLGIRKGEQWPVAPGFSSSKNHVVAVFQKRTTTG